MEISQENWLAYSGTQEQIRKTASKLMKQYIATNGVEDRRALIDFAKALTDKYGAAAGAYACQMFEEIARASGLDFTAEMAELATIDEVGKAVNGCLKQSAAGNLVASVVERLTKQVAADTMLKNAKRYGAEWAWIPDGGACAFCRTLASRGWQHFSKKLQSTHADHIHANCNCEFAVRFDPNDNVEGYDPEALLKEYNSQDGRSSKDKIKAWRREIESEEETTNE